MQYEYMIRHDKSHEYSVYYREKGTTSWRTYWPIPNCAMTLCGANIKLFLTKKGLQKNFTPHIEKIIE